MGEISYAFVPPVRVVYARAIGGYDTAALAAWTRLLDWPPIRRLRPHLDTGIGVIRDDPRTTIENARRYDACVPQVPGLAPDARSGIAIQTVRGGPAAVYRHIGPHYRIRESFCRIRDEWAPGHGLKVAAGRPFLEIYLNDPLTTPPEDLVTDLCVPVEAAAELGERGTSSAPERQDYRGFHLGRFV